MMCEVCCPTRRGPPVWRRIDRSPDLDTACRASSHANVVYAAYAVCMGMGVACDTTSSVWTYGPAKVFTIFFIKLSADFSNATCSAMVADHSIH